MPDSNLTASKSLAEHSETPEDVATLYSWANLHGAKYRDFSASRAQAREEARRRVQDAEEAERKRLAEEAERRAQEEAQIAARLAAEAAEAARQAEADRLAEIARQAEAERQAVLASQEAQRQAVQQRGWQPPSTESLQDKGADSLSAASRRAQQAAPVVDPFSPFDPFEPNAYEPHEDDWTRPLNGNQGLPSQRSASNPASYAASYGEQYPSANGNPSPRQEGNRLANELQGERQNERQGSNRTALAEASFSESSYSAPLKENYSPATWQPPTWQPTSGQPSEQEQDHRDQREQSSRPAWLAPELPIPTIPFQLSSYAPAQPANQYAAAPSHPATYASSAPPPSLRSYGQAPNYTTTQMPGQGSGQNSGDGPGQGSGQGSGQGQNPSQNPDPVDDTLAGSRDRIANRWFALKSVFDPQAAPVEQTTAQPPAHVPVLAVFSLAGGVGKTSLVASLGRALSSRGERVLLVDTAAFGLLPFFFGARDQRPGMLRTFNPPGVSAEAPIQLVTLDPDGQAPEPQGADPSQGFHGGQSRAPNQAPNQAAGFDPNQDWLAQEVARYSRSSNRVLIDLPTASGSTTRRVLRLSPVVLVPVIPDMNSVVSVGAIESFFRHSAAAGGAGQKPIMPYYLLNQFDYSLPLHLDVREILREQIGDRLLPFALRRSPAVSEALAEGMTVMDYAPGAMVAEDYASLAGWVRSLCAPATQSPQSYGSVRWSER